MTVCIAEKPSVASDLVKVLGAKNFKKETAYWESDTTIVSHAIGHLVGIADPKDIDERYKAWDMKTLPMLPEKFPLVALPTTKSHLTALGKLIKRKDVTTIINACDAGREGELIFFYILDYVLKGKFAPTQETLQTKGESVEYTTPRLEGRFVAREYDGAWKRVADSDNTESATVISSWYTSVEPST